jgi:hypothetical protein
MSILDQYIKSAPSLQNCLDIFGGEWASMFPGEFSSLQAGSSPLFEDARITWAVEQFGGIQNQNILELGPLEGGHTYMLERLGAASITSVEANTRAYLKCLITKEILNLKKAHFLCGDCIEYLKQSPSLFDICFSSGILYHMINPVELIALISKISHKVFIWTHYYDSNIIHSQPHLAVKFPDQFSHEYQGFSHTLCRQEYQISLDYTGFCGGSQPHSHWMLREDILSCLRYFGFEDIRIGFDHPNHSNGPCMAIVAIR